MKSKRDSKGYFDRVSSHKKKEKRNVFILKKYTDVVLG